MKQALIENPVINSPFEEPNRHHRFSEEGITNEIVEARRVSAYFIPVPQPRKKSKQRVFDTEWTQERIRENELINRIRARVKLWREGGHPSITATTRRLLDYWRNPEREKRLFFWSL